MKLERSVILNAAMVVLALGTGAVLFVTRERPSVEEQASRPQNVFPASFDARLVSLQIRAGDRRYTLKVEPPLPDQEPSFTLIAKESSPADPEAAIGLLRSLELVSFLRRFDAEAVDRNELGFGSPRAEVIADFGSFRSKVLVGKAAVSPPGTSYVEVQPGDGREPSIGLVRSEALEELWKDPDELRPRGLVPFGSHEFVRLEIEAGGRKLSLKKGAGPSFVDEAGYRVRRAATERLLLELSTTKFERFVAAQPNTEPGAANSVTVKLQPKTGPTISLRIGGKCSGAEPFVFAIRSAPDRVSGCVTSALTEAIAQAASSLRDDSPFSLHVDEIERLLIDRDGKKLELARTESGFELRLPEHASVGLAEGNQRLSELLSTSGERVDLPNFAALGLTPSSGSVKLWSTVLEGVPRFEETLALGRTQPDGRLPVRRAEDGVVLLLSRDAARAYTPDSALLRSTQIFDFGPSELEELSILSGGVRQLLRRTSTSGFELIEPAGFEVDGALALDLVQALATLKAERWVGDANDPSFGLESPVAVLTLRFAAGDAGPKTEVLRIGKRTSDGAFAKLESGAPAFVLPKSIADQSLRLLLSRSVFGSDRAKLDRIVLEGRGKKLVLERQGGGFVSAAGTHLAQTGVERLVEAVSHLRAEAALHTGPARPEEGFDSGVLLRLLTESEKPRVIRIGAGDSYRDIKVFYARVDGIDATYVLPHGTVRPILDAF